MLGPLTHLPVGTSQPADGKAVSFQSDRLSPQLMSSLYTLQAIRNSDSDMARVHFQPNRCR